MLLADVWASITVMVNDLIDEFKADYPAIDIQYCDWDAHATVHELPDTDLVGPMALALEEPTPEMFNITFAIGISTHSNDASLFRLRDFAGRVFERMRFGQEIVLYDAQTGAAKAKMFFADGTIMPPITKADVRPFTYCQGLALLEPGT